jgi:quercetin dioxygenase-like cupin family protein
MEPDRRQLALLFAAAAAASGQTKQQLPSTVWLYENLPVRQNGDNRSRAVFNSLATGDYPVEMHETELAPGLAPHPPHSHAHNELLILREGTLEVTIEGKTSRLSPGSIAWVASNEHHGWRNVGDTRARYFVMALGRGKA